MENKYYIPTIEEFHVGFLYERKNGEDWQKAEFGVTDCFGTFAKGYENEFEEIYKGLRDVRVRYLTIEDLKKEGYIVSIETANPNANNLKLRRKYWSFYKDIPKMHQNDGGYDLEDVFFHCNTHSGVYDPDINLLHLSCGGNECYMGKCKSINDFKRIFETTKVEHFIEWQKIASGC